MTVRLSRREHDCVMSVYELTNGGWPARVKDVATRMNVKPPTAVQFLDRLVELSLIEKGPAGYKLSEKGMVFANTTTRAHRLLETLLTNSGVRLDEACKISSSVETVMEGDAIETICSHLSHPDTCPHGRPIPAGDRFD